MPADLARFSILVRIDLFLGAVLGDGQRRTSEVSVSSCGSTVFGGGDVERPAWQRFQYPLADRLVFGAVYRARRLGERFSILVRIDLFLGTAARTCASVLSACFSILVRIDLFLGHDPGVPRTVSPFQYPRADRLVFGDGSSAAGNVLPFQYPLADRLVFGVDEAAAYSADLGVSVSSGGSTCLWGRNTVTGICP